MFSVLGLLRPLCLLLLAISWMIAILFTRLAALLLLCRLWVLGCLLLLSPLGVFIVSGSVSFAVADETYDEEISRRRAKAHICVLLKASTTPVPVGMVLRDGKEERKEDDDKVEGKRKYKRESQLGATKGCECSSSQPWRHHRHDF